MAIEKLRAYCDKILPTVYDDALSYYEVLCRLAERIDEIETESGIISVNGITGENRNIDIGSDDIPFDGEGHEGESLTDIIEQIMESTVDVDSDGVINVSEVTGDNVSEALNTLKSDIDNIGTDDVINTSEVTGLTATDALDNLYNNKVDKTTKVNGEELTGDIVVCSNDNIIINPHFGVGQNSETYPITEDNKIFSDRWITYIPDEGSVTMENGIVTIDATTSMERCGINYKIEKHLIPKILNRNITLSIIMSDDTIYEKTGVVTLDSTRRDLLVVKDNENRSIVWLYGIQTTEPEINIVICAQPTYTVSFKKVKLEIGKVSTIANDAPERFEEQYLECQRTLISKYKRVFGGTAVTNNDVCRVNCLYVFPLRMLPPIASNINIGDSVVMEDISTGDDVTGEITKFELSDDSIFAEITLEDDVNGDYLSLDENVIIRSTYFYG